MLTELHITKKRSVIVHYAVYNAGKVKVTKVTPSKGKFPDVTKVNKKLVHASKSQMRGYLKRLFQRAQQGPLVDRIIISPRGIDKIVSSGIKVDGCESIFLDKCESILLLNNNSEVKLQKDADYVWS